MGLPSISFGRSSLTRFDGIENPTPMLPCEDTGDLHALVEIPPGRYQYRLIIDGDWQSDRYNEMQQMNAYGEPNSVLIVPEA